VGPREATEKIRPQLAELSADDRILKEIGRRAPENVAQIDVQCAANPDTPLYWTLRDAARKAGFAFTGSASAGRQSTLHFTGPEEKAAQFEPVIKDEVLKAAGLGPIVKKSGAALKTP
jgi:hypothetical protein